MSKQKKNAGLKELRSISALAANSAPGQAQNFTVLFAAVLRMASGR